MVGCIASYVFAVTCVSLPVFFALRKRQQDTAKKQVLENQENGEDHKDVPLESVEEGKNQLKQRLLEEHHEDGTEHVCVVGISLDIRRRRKIRMRIDPQLYFAIQK